MAPDSIDSYRYERKFAVPDLTVPEVEREVLSHRAAFRQAYAPRYVNNLYFDANSSPHYVAAVEGVRNREKYRLRWYGPRGRGGAGNAQLEIKFKRNLLNDKKVYPLGADWPGGNFHTEILERLRANESIPPETRHVLRELRPVLINRYHRRYFFSGGTGLRLTIDYDIEYLDVGGAKISPRRGGYGRMIVVELKYSPERDEAAREVASSMPFRMTKNSKYTNGVDALRVCGLLWH